MLTKKDLPPLSLILLTATVRLIGVALTGNESASQDMGYWVEVASALREGKNPYSATPYLNWPPFWMFCIWMCDYLAEIAGMGLKVTLKLLLVGGDLLVLFFLHSLFTSLGHVENRHKLLLWGFALNPALILLTCVHGNFDVFVAVWCVLATLFSIRFAARGIRKDRLLSSASIGMGVLTKTIPFVLFPLLFTRGRRIGESILATVLALGPASIAMAILYILDPISIDEKVIGYRGNPGWYGISGFLDTVGLNVIARKVYPSLFFLALLSVLMYLLRIFRETTTVTPEQILTTAILLLLFVPTLGPGYGLQYAYWALPLIIVGIDALGARIARASKAYLFSLAIIYPILYGTSPTLGAFIPHIAADFGWAIQPLDYTRFQSTLLTLPIFITACWTISECFVSLSPRMLRASTEKMA